MAKVTFQYNIDSKDVVLASDRTLSLKEQIKAMRTELLKTQEGTAEFDILAKKLNETTDNFNRVNAKSKELFGTFSLLPGTLGDISGQLDGSIGLLKTFSGFSLKDITSQFGNLLDDIGEIITNMLGLNSANKTVATSTKSVAVAQEGAAIATEANAAATEGLTVAEEGATVAAEGLGAALKAIGIGLIVAAVAALVTYWDELKDAISGTSDVTRAYDDAQKEVTKSVKDFDIKLFEVKDALKAAEEGTISKKEALKIYNEKLGQTVGYAGSLEQAESLMASNTQTVIEGIKLRAQAQIFYAKSAEAAAKAVSGEGVDPGFWQSTWNFIKSGGNLFTYAGNQAETVTENLNDINEQTKKFAAEGDKLTQQAIENDKKLKKGLAKPPEEKKEGGKDPAVEAKKQALKDIAALEHEGYLNSLSAQEKEEQIVKDKYDKQIAAAKKYGQDTTDLEKYRQQELDKIATKYSDETYKKDIERQKQANQLKSEESNQFYEKQKAKYGEDSEQAKAALQSKYDAELKIYTDELTALNDKVAKGMKLTDDEIKKQGELTLSIAKVATTREIEGQKMLDKETARQIKMAENQMKALDKELENEDTSLQRKKEILAQEDQLELDSYNKQIAAAGENTAKKEEIENNHTNFLADQAKKRETVEKASADTKRQILLSYVDSVGQIGNLLKENAGKNKGLAKAGLIIEQAAGVASIIINTQKAAAKAGYLTPAGVSILLAGAIGVAKAVFATTKGIQEIDNTDATTGNGGGSSSGNSEQPRKLAKGGMISGPGTSTSDSIPAMLSTGESVINAQSTAMFTPLLSAINQAGGGAKFADGGIAPYSSIDKSEPYASLFGDAPVIKTYVVASDMTSQQQMDRNAKMRSTL